MPEEEQFRGEGEGKQGCCWVREMVWPRKKASP